MCNTSEQHNINSGQFLPHRQAVAQTHPKLHLAGDSTPKHHWEQQLGRHMAWNPRYCQTELIQLEEKRTGGARLVNIHALLSNIHVKFVFNNSLTRATNSKCLSIIWTWCFWNISAHLLKIINTITKFINLILQKAIMKFKMSKVVLTAGALCHALNHKMENIG